MQPFKIGELAKKTEVHIETLRFYERKGLLHPSQRTEKGYRLYDHEDIARVRFIKEAQKLGFSLKEVMDLLQLRLDRKSKCGDVEKRVKGKIEEINHKIKSLEKIRTVLETLARACQEGVPSSECSILKAFDNPSSRKSL